PSRPRPTPWAAAGGAVRQDGVPASTRVWGLDGEGAAEQESLADLPITAAELFHHRERPGAGFFKRIEGDVPPGHPPRRLAKDRLPPLVRAVVDRGQRLRDGDRAGVAGRGQHLL